MLRTRGSKVRGYLLYKIRPMKKNTLTLVLLLTLLSTSCITEWRLNNKEDRIIGVWEIERAFYKDYNALFRDNITSQYRGDRIEFLRNFTSIYDDYSTRRFAYGEWELSAIREYYDDDSDLDFYLDAYFYDDLGRLTFDLNGEVSRLTFNRFNLRIPDGNGELLLKMRKIN